MKRTALRRTTPLARQSKPLSRTGRINPMSKRRAAKANEYERAKEQVRERANGRCELRTPICTGYGIEAHHLKGRVGKLLCDVEWMRWTCRSCHNYAEANPAESYERGWMVRRNGKVA